MESRFPQASVAILAAALGAGGALLGAFVGGQMSLRAAEVQVEAAADRDAREDVQSSMREYLLAVDAEYDLLLDLGELAGLEPGAERIEALDRFGDEATVAGRRLMDANITLQLIAPASAAAAADETMSFIFSNGAALRSALDVQQYLDGAPIDAEQLALTARERPMPLPSGSSPPVRSSESRSRRCRQLAARRYLGTLGFPETRPVAGP